MGSTYKGQQIPLKLSKQFHPASKLQPVASSESKKTCDQRKSRPGQHKACHGSLKRETPVSSCKEATRHLHHLFRAACLPMGRRTSGTEIRICSPWNVRKTGCSIQRWKWTPVSDGMREIGGKPTDDQIWSAWNNGLKISTICDMVMSVRMVLRPDSFEKRVLRWLCQNRTWSVPGLEWF